MDLVVGAPVRDRAWIIDDWFRYLANCVEHWTHVSDVKVLLMCNESDSTARRAAEAAERCGLELHLGPTPEWDIGSYQRKWGVDRYQQMTCLRNLLLGQVRLMGPQLFWSLDTDILVGENTLSSAVDALIEYDLDAVGTKLYMTESGTRTPSYAYLRDRSPTRLDRAEAFDVLPNVDVIMASKLMTPKAYSVDYESHRLGEDIGWSKAAKSQKLKLGWDGRSVSKHVMTPEMLNRIDPRCGF